MFDGLESQQPGGYPTAGRMPQRSGFYDSKRWNYTTAVDLNQVLDEFRAAARDNGVIIPFNVIADGKIHRCNAEGKNGRGDAAYLLHIDGVPSGGFQNHRDGQGWRNWRFRPDGNTAINPAEVYSRRQQIAREQTRRQSEQRQQHENAAIACKFLWDGAEPAIIQHPYLLKKGVKPHGTRICREPGNRAGWLIVPVCDVTGRIQSIQFIAPDGTKRFFQGGKIPGGRYLIGEVTDPKGVICVGEGFATAATIYEHTGYPAVVAFSAENLESVAVSVRAKYPQARIVIAADNDWQTEQKIGRNPGIESARKAAAACGGTVAFPPTMEGVTDFNDWARSWKRGAHE
jgi:putative DNA primase/helicase